MAKPQKMSDAAAAAETEEDFWSLFFTQVQKPYFCPFQNCIFPLHTKYQYLHTITLWPRLVPYLNEFYLPFSAPSPRTFHLSYFFCFIFIFFLFPSLISPRKQPLSSGGGGWGGGTVFHQNIDPCLHAGNAQSHRQSHQ